MDPYPYRGTEGKGREGAAWHQRGRTMTWTTWMTFTERTCQILDHWEYDDI